MLSCITDCGVSADLSSTGGKTSVTSPGCHIRTGVKGCTLPGCSSPQPGWSLGARCLSCNQSFLTLELVLGKGSCLCLTFIWLMLYPRQKVKLKMSLLLALGILSLDSTMPCKQKDAM